MRKAALAIVWLTACGPSRPESMLPRYVILTTLSAASPMERSIQRLAHRRGAEILRFRSLDVDGGVILEWLRARQPAYAALILRSAEIDAAFQLAFLQLACRVDDDPFPDLAWGYFPADDQAALQMQIERLEAAEAKIEKRLLRATRFHPGAPDSELRNETLPWATRLPLRTLAIKGGDAEFLRKHSGIVEECDFLLLEGAGSPEGLRGLSRDELEKFRLDSSIVFSGADFTGVTGASFDASAAVLRRRTFDPEGSFPRTLLRDGAAALFAPLDRGDSRLIEREWTDAIVSDEPLGWVMKHGYDLAILAAGGSAPSFALPRDSDPPPPGWGSPLYQSATRVLYGDPMLKLHTREHQAPMRYVATQTSTDREGRSVLTVTWRVSAWDCSGYFTDSHGGDPRIHLRIALPRGTTRARASLLRAEAQGKPVAAHLVASAVEQWQGDSLLHVLVQGNTLALEDLVLAFQAVLE